MEEKKLLIYTQIKTTDVLIKMEFCDGYVHELPTSGIFDFPIFETTNNCDVKDLIFLATDINEFVQSTYVDYMNELSEYDHDLDNIKFGAGTRDYIINELITAIKIPNNLNKKIMIYRTPKVIITETIKKLLPNRIFENMSAEVYITIKEK